MNNPKENIVKSENSPHFNESIKRVLIDIKHLKGKQETLSSQFCAVKQENEILWRELSLLRQKHAAQQNILNKVRQMRRFSCRSSYSWEWSYASVLEINSQSHSYFSTELHGAALAFSILSSPQTCTERISRGVPFVGNLD